jgi:hypothetical protein
MSLPVSTSLMDICRSADQEAVVSLIAKMGKSNLLFFDKIRFF